MRLNYLAPDVIMSIIDGVAPMTLTRQSWQAYMPLDCPLSVRVLGFPDLPQPGVPNSAQRFIEHRSWTEVKNITTGPRTSDIDRVPRQGTLVRRRFL